MGPLQVLYDTIDEPLYDGQYCLAQKTCNIVWQVLYSAASNAYHNFNLDKSSLFISKAYANQGLKFKRIQPRAKGRAYKILKPTCHITIFVKSIN